MDNFVEGVDLFQQALKAGDGPEIMECIKYISVALESKFSTSEVEELNKRIHRLMDIVIQAGINKGK